MNVVNAHGRAFFGLQMGRDTRPAFNIAKSLFHQRIKLVQSDVTLSSLSNQTTGFAQCNLIIGLEANALLHC